MKHINTKSKKIFRWFLAALTLTTGTSLAWAKDEPALGAAPAVGRPQQVLNGEIAFSFASRPLDKTDIYVMNGDSENITVSPGTALPGESASADESLRQAFRQNWPALM